MTYLLLVQVTTESTGVAENGVNYTRNVKAIPNSTTETREQQTNKQNKNQKLRPNFIQTLRKNRLLRANKETHKHVKVKKIQINYIQSLKKMLNFHMQKVFLPCMMDAMSGPYTKLKNIYLKRGRQILVNLMNIKPLKYCCSLDNQR